MNHQITSVDQRYNDSSPPDPERRARPVSFPPNPAGRAPLIFTTMREGTALILAVLFGAGLMAYPWITIGITLILALLVICVSIMVVSGRCSRDEEDGRY